MRRARTTRPATISWATSIARSSRACGPRAATSPGSAQVCTAGRSSRRASLRSLFMRHPNRRPSSICSSRRRQRAARRPPGGRRGAVPTVAATSTSGGSATTPCAGGARPAYRSSSRASRTASRSPWHATRRSPRRSRPSVPRTRHRRRRRLALTRLTRLARLPPRRSCYSGRSRRASSSTLKQRQRATSGAAPATCPSSCASCTATRRAAERRSRRATGLGLKASWPSRAAGTCSTTSRHHGSSRGTRASSCTMRSPRRRWECTAARATTTMMTRTAATRRIPWGRGGSCSSASAHGLRGA